MGGVSLLRFAGIVVLSTQFSAMHCMYKPQKDYKESISKDPFSSSGNMGKRFQDLILRVQALESKIEAEQSNITSLGEKVSNVSQIAKKNTKSLTDLSSKVRNVEVSVESDKNYWNYSDTCGGVLVAQTGHISYSGSYQLSTASHCLWTIRVNHRSKIQLSMSSTYNSGNVAVTEYFLNDNGTHATKNTIIVASRNYLFQGPVILISALPKSTSISFTGVGKVIHEDTEFRHYHYTGYSGNFSLNLNTTKFTSETPNSNSVLKKVFSTIVINTPVSNLAEMDIQVPKNCRNTSLSVQSAGDDKVRNCCLENECVTKGYTLEGWFGIVHSSLSLQKGDLELSWRSRRNQTDSIGKCGGVMTGRTGRIFYKKYSNYLNNERCVWVIHPFPKRTVRISQFSSAFETSYDHVTISEIDKEQPTNTGLTPLTFYSLKNYTGRAIVVYFYTDSTIVRQGFELTWEAIGPSDFSRRLDDEHIYHDKPTDSNTNIINVVSKAFALYVMSNSELDSSSLNMTTNKQQAENCNNSRLGIFESSGGYLSRYQSQWISPCSLTSSNLWSTVSSDGIGMIFVENKDSEAELILDVAWRFIPPTTIESKNPDKCGGVIQGTAGAGSDTGRINYKLESAYENGERCIWILYSPKSSEIQLKLLKDGFELCCDYIIVNTINPLTGTMNDLTTVLTRENNTRTFPGPLLVVTFRSDSSVAGKGFVLEYTGRGQTTYPYSYKAIHRDEFVGSIHYSRENPSLNEYDGWDDLASEEENTAENELVIFSFSSPIEVGESNVAVVFNVTVENTNFGTDENCTQDILNFYSAPSREGFYLAESYPKTECRRSALGTCENCVPSRLGGNDSRPHTFGSSFRAFVGIYKPVKSTRNQSFDIHWDSSSGCGGLVVEDEGRIAYKSGARYKNMEQCVWTVNSPGASKIRFTLISNGFENCCDFVILSSLYPETGGLKNSSIVKAGSTVATVDGPVVFVTFRSDASVTGEGFVLSFAPVVTTTAINATTTAESLMYTYHHYHGRRRNSSFAYLSGSGGILGLGRSEIITFSYSSEPSKMDSLLRYGNTITIDTLNLSVDNDTCLSDTLNFYAYSVSRSYSIDVGNSSSCEDAVEDRMWICDNCSSNLTRSQQLTLRTTYPAFVAIYKSDTNVNDKVRKGFKIDWVDLQHSDLTTTTSPRYRSIG